MIVEAATQHLALLAQLAVLAVKEVVLLVVRLAEARAQLVRHPVVGLLVGQPQLDLHLRPHARMSRLLFIPRFFYLLVNALLTQLRRPDGSRVSILNRGKTRGTDKFRVSTHAGACPTSNHHHDGMHADLRWYWGKLWFTQAKAKLHR